jgi:hypothetical protein
MQALFRTCGEHAGIVSEHAGVAEYAGIVSEHAGVVSEHAGLPASRRFALLMQEISCEACAGGVRDFREMAGWPPRLLPPAERRTIRRASFLPAQQLERSFGAQHGAAEVHENQHSVLAVDRLNGLEHLECIGADGVFGIGRAPGSGYPTRPCATCRARSHTPSASLAL